MLALRGANIPSGPPDVADALSIKGKQDGPNVWCIPKGFHRGIRKGPGGCHDQRWIEELERLKKQGRLIPCRPIAPARVAFRRDGRIKSERDSTGEGP